MGGEECECRVEVRREQECEGDVPDGDGSGAGWRGGDCATQGLVEAGGPGGGGRCAGTVLVKRERESMSEIEKGGYDYKEKPKYTKTREGPAGRNEFIRIEMRRR